MRIDMYKDVCNRWCWHS